MTFWTLCSLWIFPHEWITLVKAWKDKRLQPTLSFLAWNWAECVKKQEERRKQNAQIEATWESKVNLLSKIMPSVFILSEMGISAAATLPEKPEKVRKVYLFLLSILRVYFWTNRAQTKLFQWTVFLTRKCRHILDKEISRRNFQFICK